ncbi:Protein of unknown function [Gryllus bimaculatus]|nr:Protein of unknown function [Gryllus bimaculatus]
MGCQQEGSGAKQMRVVTDNIAVALPDGQPTSSLPFRLSRKKQTIHDCPRLCNVDDCHAKCCKAGLVAAAKAGGGWSCAEDARGYWSPANSSFARFFDKETPFHNSGSRCFEWPVVPVQRYRLSPEDPWVPQLLQRRIHHFLFSSWDTCVDCAAGRQHALGETLVLLASIRASPGALLAAARPYGFRLRALAATAPRRRRVQQWQRYEKAPRLCLACSRRLLAGFNLGQWAYYMTLQRTR